ncbi:putative LPS assembly protein LptD, partial [Maribacter flavus]|uniref:putative LPS assembly protein LptD n=1 Tax=Maribacter flavus TaxID=1658664 RepID=UPI003D347E8A
DEYVEGLDGDGRVVEYSRFDGTLNGAPGLGRSNSLSLALNNVLEAKERDKDSTKSEPKMIPLLCNFNLSTAFNLEAT